MDSLSNHLAQLTKLIGRMETNWLRWVEGSLSLSLWLAVCPWTGIALEFWAHHFLTDGGLCENT